MTAAGHVPVMRAELVEALNPRDGGIYLDGTFGAGGHTKAILDAADCKVLALDRDPQAVRRGRDLLRDFPRRLILVEGPFSDLETIARRSGFEKLDGVALDLGLSSLQLADARRGFSFAADGPLDMRIGGQSKTAADWINTLSEKTLARVLAVYGEERAAKKIARAIAAARRRAPLRRTAQLAELIMRVRPPGPRRAKIHPATKSFQALRILTNDELRELAAALTAAERLLAEGGRLVVISFHSLEDRIVKTFLRLRQGPPPLSFQNALRRVRRPGKAETAANPRARSARMRVAIRTGAPAHPAPGALALPPDPLHPVRNPAVVTSGFQAS